MQNKKQKFNYPKKALIAFVIITGLFACSKTVDTTTNMTTSTVDCSGAAKSFSADVSPIIQSSCGTGSSCHGSASNNGPGELLSYSEIFNARAQIQSAILSGAMPKNGSLTIAQKNSIICWIDNGSSNN
jgi:hypothetical protein